MQTSTASHLPSVAKKSRRFVQSVAEIALRQTFSPAELIAGQPPGGHRCSQLAVQAMLQES